MNVEPSVSTEACPFCGSFDLEVLETPALFVVCNNCGAEGPYHHSDIDAAIRLWNLRAPAGADTPIDHGIEE